MSIINIEKVNTLPGGVPIKGNLTPIGTFGTSETETHYLLELFYDQDSAGSRTMRRGFDFPKGQAGAEEVLEPGAGIFYAFINLGRQGTVFFYNRYEDPGDQPCRVFYCLDISKEPEIRSVMGPVIRLCLKDG